MTGRTPAADLERDREVAIWIAAEVDQAGGRLGVAASTLAMLFEAEHLDAPMGARIHAALAGEDLRTTPALQEGGIAPDVLVEIRNPRRAVSQHDPAPEPTPAPAIAPVDSPAEVLAERAGALPAAAVTAGVLIPGTLLVAAGLAGWWVYSLLFLGVMGATWALARRARFWLARIFFLPLGRPWLTGFALTAAPLLLAAALVGLFVISPIAAGRAAEARENDGKARLAAARHALSDGDLDRARRDLAAARERDPDVAGTAALARRIEEEQRRRDAETQRRNSYQRARAALVADDEPEALTLLGGLDGYRDSERLARRATRSLAAEQLERARSALHRGEFEVAQATATQSLATRATPAARRVRADARRALARQRARATARARARARARALARAEARRRAEERRRQRQLERQRDETESAPPAAPAPSGTCEEIGASDIPVPPGDPRDRDNDGIACES